MDFNLTSLHVDGCSVGTLAEVLRQAIENEEKLINELVLPGASLEIREVCRQIVYKFMSYIYTV